jgi:Xaa-Pro aminopeptidase
MSGSRSCCRKRASSISATCWTEPQGSVRLGDLMLQACRDSARHGVKECEVCGHMVEVMLSNGGEEPTLFLWACHRHPYPHPFRVPTTRALETGDVIICEIHPKYGGYAISYSAPRMSGSARMRW